MQNSKPSNYFHTRVADRKSASGRMLRAFVLVLFALVGLFPSRAEAGTWVPLVSNMPGGGSIDQMLLLSDGTVMAKSDAGAGYGVNWYRLKPDIHGSYINGTWSQLASMNDDRLYFSSQVLTNGKVFVAGGEYGAGGTTAEVYDPVANTWTYAPTISPTQSFYDSESMMLPNGDVLVSPVIGNPSQVTYIYHSATNTWSAGPLTLQDQDECSWVKLPDDSILTIDSGLQSSERYIPSLGQWVNDGPVPVTMFDQYYETGGALLLPNGKAFFLGAAGHTAIYTPSGNANPGSWVAGANMPSGLATGDAPAAMMPNGKILCVMGPVNPPGSKTELWSPSSFYEYDYTTNSFTQVNAPAGGLTDSGVVFTKMMLCLPDGTILYSDGGKPYVYQPGGTPLSAGKPTVTSISENADGSFLLTGTQLNGISQGAYYGDDRQMVTNYPIVQLTDSSNNVYYARTYNWSSTSIQTGNTPVTTDFTIPAGLPDATYSLAVIANGISSTPVAFTPFAPGVITLPATAITATSATLNGTVNPNGHATTYYFNYGLTPAMGTTTLTQSAGSGTSPVSVQAAIAALAPSSTYYFQLVATNSSGTSSGVSAGAVLTFTTPALPIYTINVSASPPADGGVSGGGNYVSGSNVTVVATPNVSFHFVNWTEGGVPVSTSASYTFVSAANRTLVANFIATYTITTVSAPVAGGGTSGGGVFNAGDVVTVVATPNPGYVFMNWTWGGNVASSSASYTFNAGVTRTLVANFAPTYTITTSASPSAYGSVTAGGTFFSGRSWTVSAIPNPGYDFVSWTEGGSVVSASAIYNFVIGSANRALVANFKISSNANLASLLINLGTLNPAFDPGTVAYAVSTGFKTTSITVTPTVVELGATMKVNSTAFTSGATSAPISLVIGANVITFLITAPDGVTTNTYTLAVTRAGDPAGIDVNGDGIPDLVFQNTAGQVYSWFLDGSGNAVNGSTGSGLVPPGSKYLSTTALGDWRLVGIGDVNHDNHPDLIFQNSTGQIYVWLLDGSGNVASGKYLYTGTLGDWRVVGVADVSGDGIPDIIFQNGTGQIYAWFLDGTGNPVSGTSGLVPGSKYLYTGTLGDWRVVGVADVSGDGIPDIIFQNTAGQIYSWFLDGTGSPVTAISGLVPGSKYLSTASLGDWRVARVGDMNGDGIPDIIFQNTTGQIYSWFLDGTGNAVNGTGQGLVPGSKYLSTVNLGDWRVR